MKLDHLSYTAHKNKLKWIKDLNVKTETIKLLGENIGSNLISYWSWKSFFLDKLPRSTAAKAKTNKWHYIKLKSFSTAKKIINQTKRQPTEWEEILAGHTFTKGLLSRIYKELI